ncbi:hypothetical protein, partial [Bradyrhizobium sp. NBAIM08]|uniref:hypothetical protein n=1 Tax=Bradyrhizobium sp. NBAIM08 TaxID=2793815 RepID=UPI001CD63EB6
MALAFVVETGKLFAPEHKPDPTNILIAACAAYLAYVVAAAVWRWATQKSPRAAPAVAGSPKATATTQSRSQRVPAADESGASLVSRAMSLPLLIVVAAFALAYPYGAALVGFLALYAALIWRWPQAALPAVLA